MGRVVIATLPTQHVFCAVPYLFTKGLMTQRGSIYRVWLVSIGLQHYVHCLIFVGAFFPTLSSFHCIYLFVVP